MIFLDTSGIYALADVDDANHQAAVDALQAAQNAGRRIVTSSYVLVESECRDVRAVYLVFKCQKHVNSSRCPRFSFV